MKKKLFTLLTLLVMCVTGAWADETYYLQTPGAATPALTGEFFTGATLNQDVSCSYNEVNYTKAVKFGTNISSWSNMSYQNDMIRYDCKTTQTDFTVVVYSTGSGKKFYLGDVKETSSDPSVSALTEYTATQNAVTTQTWSVDNSTNGKPASFYVSVGDKTNVFIVQIIATEKGTALPAPCTAGYTANFVKGRLCARSGVAVTLDASSTRDGIEIHQNQNYVPGTTTSLKMQTKGTNYIKFSIANPMVLSFTTSSTTQYNVSTTKGTDTDKVSPTSGVAKKFNLTAGTYYINPQGSNVTPTKMSFSAAPVVTYNNNGGTGSMANSYFTVSACTFTAPTGQEFQEWNTESEGTGESYEAGDEVESNTTLYAIWYTPAVKHHVTYDLNGGTGTTPTQDDVEEGQTFEVASGTTGITAPDGKVFSTWNDGSTDYAPGDSYPMGTSDVTLTAQWINLYTITYDKGANGTGSISNGQKTEGVAFTLSSEMFTREGYVQTGWATSDGGAKVYNLGGSYTTNAAITLYPVWEGVASYGFAFTYAGSAPAGWTFSTDDGWADNKKIAAYVKDFTDNSVAAPGDNGMKDGWVAFAKNTSALRRNT